MIKFVAIIGVLLPLITGIIDICYGIKDFAICMIILSNINSIFLGAILTRK